MPITDIFYLLNLLADDYKEKKDVFDGLDTEYGSLLGKNNDLVKTNNMFRKIFGLSQKTPASKLSFETAQSDSNMIVFFINKYIALRNNLNTINNNVADVKNSNSVLDTENQIFFAALKDGLPNADDRMQIQNIRLANPKDYVKVTATQISKKAVVVPQSIKDQTNQKLQQAQQGKKIPPIELKFIPEKDLSKILVAAPKVAMPPPSAAARPAPSAAFMWAPSAAARPAPSAAARPAPSAAFMRAPSAAAAAPASDAAIRAKRLILSKYLEIIQKANDVQTRFKDYSSDIGRGFDVAPDVIQQIYDDYNAFVTTTMNSLKFVMGDVAAADKAELDRAYNNVNVEDNKVKQQFNDLQAKIQQKRTEEERKRREAAAAAAAMPPPGAKPGLTPDQIQAVKDLIKSYQNIIDKSKTTSTELNTMINIDSVNSKETEYNDFINTEAKKRDALRLKLPSGYTTTEIENIRSQASDAHTNILKQIVDTKNKITKATAATAAKPGLTDAQKEAIKKINASLTNLQAELGFADDHNSDVDRYVRAKDLTKATESAMKARKAADDAKKYWADMQLNATNVGAYDISRQMREGKENVDNAEKFAKEAEQKVKDLGAKVPPSGAAAVAAQEAEKQRLAALAAEKKKQDEEQERKRKEAEQKRLKEAAEQRRVEAEKLKQEQEKRRQEDEKRRQEQERLAKEQAEKQKQEQARIAAEQAEKQKQEQERQRQEQERQRQEQARLAAEQKRKEEAERQRLEAERLRLAEEDRKKREAAAAAAAAAAATTTKPIVVNKEEVTKLIKAKNLAKDEAQAGLNADQVLHIYRGLTSSPFDPFVFLDMGINEQNDKIAWDLLTPQQKQVVEAGTTDPNDQQLLAKLKTMAGGGCGDPYYMKYMKYRTKYLIKSGKTDQMIRTVFKL